MKVGFNKMKVFISWSGDISLKVALIFREWLPSVIQSLEPYVSSEDIDKGARWSTDIAKELEDSNFGILCVTKENLEAPWLSFEAGALSKTMEKSFVTPFLFDIKRSEVKGPILQFQSTIFEKEDIKKMVKTLNKACGDVGIPENRLETCFNVWYTHLEKSLNDLTNEKAESKVEQETESATPSSEILEEILELSRDNQRLLKSPDTKLYDSIESLKDTLEEVSIRNNIAYEENKRNSKYSSMILDEIMHMNYVKSSYGFLMILSLTKEDFPWIYDMGKELLDIIKSNTDIAEKEKTFRDFRDMIDFSLGHPIIRDGFMRNKKSKMIIKDLHYVLSKYLDELYEQYVK